MSILFRKTADRCILTIRSFIKNGEAFGKLPTAAVPKFKLQELKLPQVSSKQKVEVLKSAEKLKQPEQPAAEIKPVEELKPPEETTPPQTEQLTRKSHRVNRLEKRMLVWSGKYKNVNEIPAFVAPEVMEKARSKTRIRFANLMMLSTALACLVVVFSGKRAAARGESLQQANIDWHRRLREEHMRGMQTPDVVE